MNRRIDSKKVTELAYKSAVTSGVMIIVNDACAYVQFNRNKMPFSKILTNVGSLALGYILGKKVADESWEVMDEAIRRYNEED